MAQPSRFTQFPRVNYGNQNYGNQQQYPEHHQQQYHEPRSPGASSYNTPRTPSYGTNGPPEFPSFQRSESFANQRNYGDQPAAPAISSMPALAATIQQEKKKPFSIVTAGQFAFAEFLGSAVMMMIGCYSLSLTTTYLFGMGILVATQMIGHLSGAHLNPIISLAAVINSHINFLDLPFYLAGQFLGALLGYEILIEVSNAEVIEHHSITHWCENFCANNFENFFFECIASMVLVIVYCGFWDRSSGSRKDTFALKIGAVVAALLSTIGRSMNPTRSFIPALINNNYHESHWIFWCGPLIGCVIGAPLYRFTLRNELKWVKRF